MNLTNLSLSLNGYDIASAKKELDILNKKVLQNTERYNAQHKAAILDFHLKNNEFYSRFVSDKSTEWDALPIISKSDLQIPLNKRLSVGYSNKNCHIHKTSGSSGTPFIFAKDKYCHALTWASIQNLYLTQGIELKTSYEARFYGIPQSGISYYKERFKDFLSHRYRFSIFDSSHLNFENFIAKFKHNKFGHLNGYTSTLLLFAKYLNKKQLILRDICPTLTHCIVTAEMLLESDKQFLEHQFAVPVINEYGASETGVIALGTAQHSIKIDEALIYVEILDTSNNPVPDGKSGKIIVTSFFNKAHPFIRYQLGDIGVINRDSNGNKILTSLEGRIGDYAVLPDGSKIPALAFYYVTKNVIDDSGNVKEFVIDQQAPNSFKIIYVAENKLSESQRAKIKKSLLTYIKQSVTIEIIQKSSLNRSNRGKLKQFTRSF
ncbi:phenylacetate--CoA ligase family protein [Leeuwenhoekiella sp. LLG6367-2.1]|uniref:phenylacetate--CoA ligase family protein n=1 Tax=Leeuwenhoekiella sp. LLG6367-2.1 TaxID=3160833 RepID=UPI003864BA87